MQETRIPSPSTDCISPIGEELLLKGLHQVVPGEFYAAATRPPAVYRGNPFLIEAALAYGGAPAAQKVSLEALTELLGQSDARTLRQFLMSTFAARQRSGRQDSQAKPSWARGSRPSRLKKAEIAELHDAMQHVNLDEGQTMNVLALCQPRAAAVSARRLRDHADGHANQLAQLRPQRSRAARSPAGRSR